MRRQTMRDPIRRVQQRDATGKPALLVEERLHYAIVTPAFCVCDCAAFPHDPQRCTGEGDFLLDGRPGSGAVDRLAEKFGREPVPELILARHEVCETQVGYLLALWFGTTDDERRRIAGGEVRAMRYGDQLRLLRDLIKELIPELAGQPPYDQLVTNLKRLAGYRNKIAHSVPLGEADHFRRSKWDGGQPVYVETSAEELAEFLDLALALQSQLTFLPSYLWPPAGAADTS